MQQKIEELNKKQRDLNTIIDQVKGKGSDVKKNQVKGK
jgi:hypothetical protein